MPKAVVKVPAVWNTLLGLEEFDVDKMRDGQGQEHPADDPTPYYDDDREVAAKFDNGDSVTFRLCSGQDNYWFSLEVVDQEGDTVYEEDPDYTVGGSFAVTGYNDLEYEIAVEFV